MRAFAVSGLGWWAFSSYGLAMVMAVQHAAGSFATAGAATAAFAVGSAVLAPLRGRAVDRSGMRALAMLAALHAGILLVLLACIQDSPADWLLIGAAGLAGASAPPLMATVRLTWVSVAGTGLVRAAHAVNATLGDAASVVSPMVTSAIAAATSPALALGLLIPAMGTAVAVLAGIAPAPHQRRHEEGPRRSVLRQSSGLRWLMAGDVTSGVWLGALEVAAVALSIQAGTRLLAGAPLLGLAVGGIGASLWAGTRHGSAPPAARYVWGAVTAAVVLPVAILVQTPLALAVVALLGGVGYGLINVALLELIDDVAEPSQAVEAFTWITTAQASGLAIGAATAGALAQLQATHALYLVAGAPLLGAAAAIAGRSYFQVVSPPEPGSWISTRP